MGMYRLIVIDDDVDAVNNISKDYPWEQSGFTLVGTFLNGELALNWLRSHSVELILCDIKMPRMNGIELARQMQLMRRREKIIFISGFKDFEYARKALDYGVSSYCIKPITFREMQRTIDKIRAEIDRERGVQAGASEAVAREAAARAPEKGRSISDIKIERIRGYINDRYAGVTLQQLADYMDMNTSYLSHYFKDKTGQKLFDYITEVRLNAALQILKTDSRLNVAEVAERVGYTNAISFSRTFKKQFGVPPSEVRRDFDVTEAKR